VYWSNCDELYQHITHLDNDKLNIIRKRIKAIAERKYRWDIIVGKYEALYIQQ
jgi:hypothetical protein